MDLSDKNCLILFFLTHGKANSELFTRDDTITINTILRYISSNKSLAGKPKIFIFQACKGENFSKTGTEINTGHLSPLVAKEMIFGSTKIGDDMLIVYSTLEDHKSFRNRLYGSWFIQELCKVFTSYGKRDDIHGLIMRVSKNVAGNYYHENAGEYLKQMPVFISTLRKKFYLNRNKDRGQLLRINRELEEMHKQIKEIKSDIKKMLSKEESKKSSS